MRLLGKTYVGFEKDPNEQYKQTADKASKAGNIFILLLLKIFIYV